MSDNEAFKALADPTRREILALLRKGEMRAGDLAERFDMTKPSMSHHFAVLKEARLITSRREGQQIWYALNTTVVEDLMAWAMDLITATTRERKGNVTKDRSVRNIADRRNMRSHRDRVPTPSG
jgi:ArsR family transcriptional regulator